MDGQSVHTNFPDKDKLILKVKALYKYNNRCIFVYKAILFYNFQIQKPFHLKTHQKQLMLKTITYYLVFKSGLFEKTHFSKIHLKIRFYYIDYW